MKDNIDFDTSDVLRGERTVGELGEKLPQEVQAVANC